MDDGGAEAGSSGAHRLRRVRTAGGRARDCQRQFRLAAVATGRLPEAAPDAALLAVAAAGAGPGAPVHRRSVQMRVEPPRAVLHLPPRLAVAVRQLQEAATAEGARQGGDDKQARLEAKRVETAAEAELLQSLRADQKAQDTAPSPSLASSAMDLLAFAQKLSPSRPRRRRRMPTSMSSIGSREDPIELDSDMSDW